MVVVSIVIVNPLHQLSELRKSPEKDSNSPGSVFFKMNPPYYPPYYSNTGPKIMWYNEVSH